MFLLRVTNILKLLICLLIGSLSLITSSGATSHDDFSGIAARLKLINISTKKQWVTDLHFDGISKKSATKEVVKLGAGVTIKNERKEHHQNIGVKILSHLNSDKGWRLRLQIRAKGKNARWHLSPFKSKKLENDDRVKKAIVSNYPLAGLSFGGSCYIIGIPITSPSVFRFFRVNKTLILEIFLGTSPLTKPVANLSWADMFVRKLKGRKSCFRKGLQAYYKAYKGFYTRRNKQTGQWSTATSEGLKRSNAFHFHEHGNIFFSLNDSSATEIGNQLKTDKNVGWKLFPYLHSGQISRVNLSRLPQPNENIASFLKQQKLVFSQQQMAKYQFLDDWKNSKPENRPT